MPAADRRNRVLEYSWQVPGLGAEAGAALAAHAGVDKISFTGSGVRPPFLLRAVRRLAGRRGSPWLTPKAAVGQCGRRRHPPSASAGRRGSPWLTPKAAVGECGRRRHPPSASAVGICRVRQPTSRKIMAAAAMGPRAISLELGGKVRRVRA